MFPMIVYSKTSENWQAPDIGDNTKSAVVFIVERLSSSQRFTICIIAIIYVPYFLGPRRVSFVERSIMSQPQRVHHWRFTLPPSPIRITYLFSVGRGVA